MYSYISGELVEVNEDSIVVDNQGIGYEFAVSRSTVASMRHLGQQVKVYTYLHVREDAMMLFGFATREELELFRLLIGVNGIGPKGALAILGVLTPSDLRFAILAEDAKAIAAAPGIGAKTAQRVIIDLRDKIDGVSVSGLGYTTQAPGNQAVKQDVLEAMESLGYSASEALRAMEGIEFDDDATVEVVLKEVLKKMSFL
ncbi:MAG: Holliday junction branch migration protein RuvA [Lachnospiraceae bacterium]|nr:Holliday junction branch migration protein RuvA [Lachnospiraceae bacterium]